MREGYQALDAQLASRLSRRATLGRLRKLSSKTDKVDFSSNSYLSLSTHPEIRSAYLRRLQSGLKTLAIGSGGSRLLDGNSKFAEELEKQIASFHQGPAALLFNSGFEANTGLFSCVPQGGDVVVYDELVHASIHDGLRLSRASRMIPFAHNQIYDLSPSPSPCQETAKGAGNREMGSGIQGLATVLHELLLHDTSGRLRRGQANVFIAVESLYSMDGDVAPLKAVAECIRDLLPAGNGYLIVDEAHSTGVFGEHGRGLVCELGLSDKVWARVHTFGKAVDCSGAIVLCSETTREYLINYARSFIFTTAMGYPQLASIRTCYDFLTQGKADKLIMHLHALSKYCLDRLEHLCSVSQYPEVMQLYKGNAKSPIIALLTTKPRDLARHCQEAGYMVRPIVYPTVPKGTERVRICLHVKNSFEEIDGLCHAIQDWFMSQSRSAMGVKCQREDCGDYNQSRSSAAGLSFLERAKL